MSETAPEFDWETMSDGIETASEETPVEETAEEETAPERPRNERGQFVGAEEADLTPKEVVTEALIEDKYANDPEKLTQSLVEMQRLYGDQSREVGELRQSLQQLQAHLDQQQRSQVDYSEYAEDPGAAAELMYQNNDPRWQNAWNQWRTEDPVLANMWAENKRLALQVQSQQAQQQQQFAATANDLFQRGFASLNSKYPDLEQRIPEISQYIEARPAHKVAFDQGPPEVRLQIIEDAYLISHARSAETVRSAAQVIATEQAQATEQALNDAFVASGTNTVREAPGKTEAELIAEEWDTIPTSIHWGT